MDISGVRMDDSFGDYFRGCFLRGLLEPFLARCLIQ